jgi:hypothetical protein
MPYNILKNGLKYELRLVKSNKLLGTHNTRLAAAKQIQAIEINKTGRLHPDLWKKAEKIAYEKFNNKHSARMRQYQGRVYRNLGGGYTKELKPNQKSLKKWTAENWGRDIPKGRYLPKRIREELSAKDYMRTSIAKIKGKTQYVKQPEDIVKKIRKIKEKLKNNLSRRSVRNRRSVINRRSYKK